jgi:hypothetical protein
MANRELPHNLHAIVPNNLILTKNGKAVIQITTVRWHFLLCLSSLSMPDLAFSSRDILEGRLRSDRGTESSGSFIIQTRRSRILRTRRETTVTSYSSFLTRASNSGSALGGSINWKDHSFEIAGVVKPVKDVMRKREFFGR